MADSALLSEISWVDYRRRVRDERAVVLLPIGSLEQHGPHSPTGSDEMLTRLIALAVAERSGSLVAPSISYGCWSQPRTGGGNHFDGTISISGNTMTALVGDVLCEFVRKGATRILVLDTHYENEWFVIEGVERAIRDLRLEGFDDPKIVKVRYFELIEDDVMEQVFPDGFPGWPLEHAGVMTTSLHLYLTPDIVDMEKAPSHGPIRYPPYDIFPFDPSEGTQTGCLNSPQAASSKKGEIIFDCVVARLVDIIRKEFEN